MKLLKRLAALCVTMALVLCGCGEQSPATHTAYRRAIYIYMCGSSLETHSGAATQSIADMLQATIPDDTCVIVQTGGTKTWRDFSISSDVLSRYILADGNLRLLETVPVANMGDADTVVDFLSFCKERYPAQESGVIFWDHGGGSINGVCNDELYDMDALSLAELREAIGTATENGLEPFSMIGFDACLMANYETAKVLSPYANYMIASVDVEPNGGWDYRPLLENFGIASYDKLLTAYQTKCEQNGINLYTLSCVDLKRFDAVETAFSDMVAALDSLAEKDLSTVSRAAQNSLSYGIQSSFEGYSNTLDLGLFADALGCSAMSEAIASSVSVVNSLSRCTSTGLSVFYPLADVTRVGEYLALGSDEAYCRFLREYYTDLPQGSLIRFADRGQEQNGELSICLEKSSLPYVHSVEYKLTVLHTADNGTVTPICLGNDTDIVQNETTFTTSYDGMWVAWDGRMIYVETIDRSGDITTFATPILRNGTLGTVRFVYDLSERSYRLQGFLPLQEEGMLGRLQQLQNGDEITLLSQHIGGDLSETWHHGEHFVYDDSATLATRPLEDVTYVLFVRVKDVFGSVHHSRVLVVRHQNENVSDTQLFEDFTELTGQ